MLSSFSNVYKNIKRNHHTIIPVAYIIFFSFFAVQATQASHPKLQDTISVEIDRAIELLGKESPSLYYLGCGITDIETTDVEASFGALIKNNQSRSRILDVDARCGNYTRDNTHPLPGPGGFTWTNPVRVPLDDDPDPIRMALWREIEKSYRGSSKQYAKVKAFDITKSALRDGSDDFSKATPEKHHEKHNSINVNRDLWAKKVKAYTLPLRNYPDIYLGEASFKAVSMTRTFSNSEGAQIQSNRVGYYLTLNVATRAQDGLDLPVFESFFAWNLDELPDDRTVSDKMVELANLAIKLKSAPLAEPYAGPAILSGNAAAVFMHEVIGHRLEGHRQKDESHSQTFRTMVGSKVMPEFLTVIFDPGIKYYGNKPVAGHYKFDEQGISGQKVVSIDKGILKNFLMSRTPIEGFSQSNGHGRAQAGKMAVSRQSNLIVETTNPVSTQSLRKSLIEECIRQKKPYGLLFSQIKGGYTITSRTSPNTFNITPLVVYRVYTDGRPDELVRGVDIVGTPLTAIAKIIASGNDVAVFNGYCGAESGSVTVGAVSPSLLVKELEVQRKSISQATPPVLAAPKDSFGPYADGLKKGSKKDKTEQIIEVMETEIARTINHLRLPDSPLPYFASCAIIKSKKVYAGAELGSTIYSKNSQYAKLNVSLRVGDHKLDNTNFMPPYPSDGNSILDVTMPVPIDMDPFVIRRAIWLSMDQAYKTAIENFKRKKSVLQTLASLPDENDFSGAQVYTHFPKIKPVRLPEAKELEKKAKDISMVMRDAPGLRRSYTGVGTDRYETWYANSEGSKNHNVTTSAYVASLALAQSEDGTMVGDNISFFADDIDTLKPLPGIKKAVKKLCLRVSSMSTAPKIDDYIGPVLFEGQAAAELCSRVLSPAFSNYRKPVAEWVQWKKRSGSLRRKIGSRIMSTAFNVFDDPTINILKGGHYLKSTDVDLEGVKPEKVQLVKNGILKTLLTTRNPDKRLPKSNGHAFHVSKGSSGTLQYYASPTNLFIEYKKGVKRKKLKKRLLKAIKDQGIEYGLIIRRISPEGLLLVEGSSYYNYGGGESGDINDPMFAFRVFPDGREELVRVGLLNRIQISTFKDVLTAGKKQYVLSSREGERLISVIAPSILFEEGILQKYEGDIYKSSIIESPILSINK